jgi:peptide/nickel transport system permease protein
MTRFLLRRLGSGLILLFLLQAAVFFIVQIIMPGDFVGNFVLNISPEEAAAWRVQLGLDLPLWQQYLNWVKQAFTLDLGMSFYGYPVMEGIMGALPYTVLVFVTGLGLAFMTGYWLGRVTAWKGPGFFSDGVTFTAITFYAFFPPALAYLLNLLLGRLGLGATDLNEFNYYWDKDFIVPQAQIVREMAISISLSVLLTLLLWAALRRVSRRRIPFALIVPSALGLWAASWYFTGIWPAATRMMGRAIIPIIAFYLLSVGEMLVITRTAMNETLREEYITTARAKGLNERAVRDRHAARNAILPVMSKMAISLPYLLAGLAIIEQAMRWSGLGGSLFSASQLQDIPVVLGYLLFIGALTLLIRLLLDILVAVMDPRIRYSGRSS